MEAVAGGALAPEGPESAGGAHGRARWNAAATAFSAACASRPGEFIPRDWASNFWGDSPYTDPASHGGDNGNMYLFYPGKKLDTIGLPSIKGPVSSFRMKMVRRGIQDYEYFLLARAEGVDPAPIVDSIVHRGLKEAGGGGIDPEAWSRDAEDWYRARDELGRMIDAKTRGGK